MQIAIRADASAKIGHGHLMRCLTLASALRSRGAKLLFVCREHDGNLCSLLEEHGYQVRRLSRLESRRTSERTDWLGAPWHIDAEQTLEAVKDELGVVDWLVVDHYGIGHDWEAALRPSTRRIMVIDDLADRRHDCDLLLDQNLIASMDTRYSGLVSRECLTLLGPDYALLQPDYALLHDRVPPREDLVEKILVSFGGADPASVTGRAVSAFLGLRRSDIELIVVLGGSDPQLPAIRRQAAGHPNVRVESDVPTLAPLIAEADLALGAGGSTSWERLCLGLPALVVTLAENQRPIARELARRGLVRLLGHHDDVDEARIATALADVICKPLDSAWSTACLAAVDGRGVGRVCAALTVSTETPLRARPAMARDTSSVSADNQRKFRRCLRELSRCRSYVVETADAVVVGEVRFEKAEEPWSVNWNSAPAFRGCDIRRGAVAAAISEFWPDAGAALRLKAADSNTDRRSPSEKSAIRSASTLRISVCSDAESWVNPCVAEMLADWLAGGHAVTWTSNAEHLGSGDICFFLSYGRIVNAATLALHRHNLVVHASDLPRGRGWSPLTWQILEGSRRIPVTLFEAAEAVDSGPVYAQVWIETSGLELIEELRDGLCRATLQLCEGFVADFPASADAAKPQLGEPTFYPRRRPRDSRIDIDRPLREQINLLRTADPDRYPAWFEIDEARFAIRVKRLED